MIEAKTPVRASQSWFDAALQIHDDYETQRPRAVRARTCSRSPPRARSSATARSACRSSCGDRGGSRPTATRRRCSASRQAVDSMLRPHVVLDLLANFTAYATDKKKRRIKIIARYQQYEGANQIVERVVAGHPKKGLIWHFQGSGKSLLMLFAARKLRLHPALKNPDRDDRGRPHRPRQPDLEHLLRRGHAEPRARPRAAPSCSDLLTQDVAQDHHHHDLQVRRGRRRPERPQQHHRDGGRGPPHAGRRPRPQDARGAAERVPVRPDRHADQPRRPQHLLRLRRRGGRSAAT